MDKHVHYGVEKSAKIAAASSCHQVVSNVEKSAAIGTWSQFHSVNIIFVAISAKNYDLASGA